MRLLSTNCYMLFVTIMSKQCHSFEVFRLLQSPIQTDWNECTPQTPYCASYDGAVSNVYNENPCNNMTPEFPNQMSYNNSQRLISYSRPQGPQAATRQSSFDQLTLDDVFSVVCNDTSLSDKGIKQEPCDLIPNCQDNNNSMSSCSVKFQPHQENLPPYGIMHPRNPYHTPESSPIHPSTCQPPQVFLPPLSPEDTEYLNSPQQQVRCDLIVCR